MKKNSILKLIIIIIFLIIITATILFYSMIAEQKKVVGNDIQNSIENTSGIQLKEKYECNEFSFTTITAENLLSMYLNDYKNNMLNNPEKAYNSLNSEYKEEQFGDIEKYKEYINNNIEKIEQIKLNKYLINNYEEYDEYICTDQYNNYYIFNVTAVMKYTIMLDTYKVLSGEVLEKYNQLTDMQKGGYNVERCIEAINCKDYSYVYGKLDDTFKTNNYKTIEMLEKNIKENLFETNKANLISSTREGDIYIYKLNIEDIDDSTKQKNMTIIMKLKEGTDFEMSFSFE